MLVFDTKHKIKSVVTTSVILLILLYLIFNYGMSYLDPPIEYGIAINYGTSDVGKGKSKLIDKVKNTSESPTKKQKIEEEVVQTFRLPNQPASSCPAVEGKQLPPPPSTVAGAVVPPELDPAAVSAAVSSWGVSFLFSARCVHRPPTANPNWLV